jgi:hypothetical protein
MKPLLSKYAVLVVNWPHKSPNPQGVADIADLQVLQYQWICVNSADTGTYLYDLP